MRIKLLKANNGDSILISYKGSNEINRNILIDGGTPQTYKYKNPKGRLEAGALKTVIDEIDIRGESIDLLIVTHVDNDHIGGILKWIESGNNFDKIVKHVWFNSGSSIFEHFGVKPIIDNSVELKVGENNNTSIKQGITFENYIEGKGIWYKELVFQNQDIDFLDLRFKILTPSIQNLKKLLCKWEDESEKNLTSKSTDYHKTVNELWNEDHFIEDDSIYNGSSISFILEFRQHKMLFLADSHPTDVVNGLKYFGYNCENKIHVNFVKVSHHGSQKNISDELLSCLVSPMFLISSNGNVHNLPDKRCLARILKSNSDAQICFNYSEKINEIFTNEEIDKFKFMSFEEIAI